MPPTRFVRGLVLAWFEASGVRRQPAGRLPPAVGPMAGVRAVRGWPRRCYLGSRYSVAEQAAGPTVTLMRVPAAA